MTNTIGVIGAGAWGTALAQSFARNGRDVILWARDPALSDTINTKHENPAYLPHMPLHDHIRATSDLAEVCASDVIVPVVPAQTLRGILERAAPFIGDKPLILCCKGIEIESGLFMSDVAAATAPDARTAILSGPNFAHEIAKGLPAAATLAHPDPEKFLAVRDALASKSLRIYLSDDMIGVQVGGAVKNVIAIVCGIIAGRHMGENARAAVVTRGLHEMARLAEAMGGKRETLMGLSGIGDLILTCSSMQSRNFSLGVALGEGKPLSDILNSRHGVTEGVPTAEALVALARHHNIDMPILTTLHHCLGGAMSIDDAIHALMNRPYMMETE